MFAVFLESSVEIGQNHQPFISFLLITGAAKLKLSNTTTQNILLLQKNASVVCTSPFSHAFFRRQNLMPAFWA